MSVTINGTGNQITGISGQILQVVSGTLTTGDTTVDWTSGGAAFGTFSITPKQSTSRIVCIMNGNIYQSGSGRAWGAWYHNTSGSYVKLVESFYITYYTNSASYAYAFSGGIGFDHSPGTTNTVSYRFNLGKIGSTQTGVADYGTIYLLEIST